MGIWRIYSNPDPHGDIRRGEKRERKKNIRKEKKGSIHV
jgi:hypothetical protein